MKVVILTTEKIIYEGEVIRLQVESYFQLLDHHASMISILKDVNLQLDKLIFTIKYGILEVNNGIVKIFINS